MPTFAEILAHRTTQLEAKLRRFLLDLSDLCDGSDSFYEFAQMGFVMPSLALFPGRWGKLSDEGLRVQSELLEDTTSLISLYDIATAGLTSSHQRHLDEVKDALLSYINHERTPHTSTAAAWTNAERQLRKLNELATFLAGSGSGRTFLVPDTNALYTNTALEDWTFPGLHSFVLCLVPTVLGEIDAHHHHHPNESIRKKAANLRAKFKEYNRRGDTTSGVPIVKGKIEFRAFPTSKAFELARPGTLDPSRPDDQVISSMLDLVRKYPGENVQIITSDVLMQVKLRAMGLPFMEPPATQNPSTS